MLRIPDTPGSFYRPSDSSSDSDEIPLPSRSSRSSRSSREELNTFLASRDISPIRSHLKMPWELASDRTQRYHTRKARQIVEAALEEIAPQDAENLWNSLVKSKVAMEQTADALDLRLMDALAECYNNASDWISKRQILSIMADKVNFRVLQRWLPGLTRYRFNVARHHLLLHGRGSIVPATRCTRMYVSAEKLDHFLNYITSAHIVQDLPFGEKMLSTKEEIVMPNVVRTLIPERIIQQYNLFCSESGFALRGRSTLHAVLNVCSASVRNSLRGLDYFTVQGAKAFDDLEDVVDKLAECCEKGFLWAKEKKEQLKAAKPYLKGDYKVTDHCNYYKTIPQE